MRKSFKHDHLYNFFFLRLEKRSQLSQFSAMRQAGRLPGACCFGQNSVRYGQPGVRFPADEKDFPLLQNV